MKLYIVKAPTRYEVWDKEDGESRVLGTAKDHESAVEKLRQIQTHIHETVYSDRPK